MTDIFDALVPDNVKKAKPYQPGKPIEELQRELGLADVIKIASNENPMGPSPKAIEAAAAALASSNSYPDGGCFKLRTALAERLDVAPDELVFGAGCNEIVYLIVRAFCRPGIDEVLTHKYAFISYRLAAMVHNVGFVESEVTDALACDVDALIAAIKPETRVVFLANPNNPTGAHHTRAGLEKVIEALPARTVLVVDEAYHEYAVAADADYARSTDYRGVDRPLLVTLRTFSKIYGLAGLRIGYGIADRRVVDYLDRVRRPFNVSSIAQAAALAALSDDAHIKRSSDAALSGIAALRSAVAELGLVAYPSLGNFVLVDVGRDAVPVYDKLLRRGVIVRPMSAWGLPRHLRISIGTPDETKRVVSALADELK